MSSKPRIPSERFVRVAAVVRREIEHLERIVKEAEEAIADFRDREPPVRELRGIGGIVHDFYTGVERVFETIAPELNGGIPLGSSWHRELLENMTLDLPSIRPSVLRRTTAQALEEFLRFRHLFRNVYGFELQWTRLKPLVERVPS